MSELEIVLGILASVSALYGFTIAYYVFARGLQLQEEEGVWAANRKGREPKTKEDRDEALGKIAWRRVLLNIFLIGSTISFTFSAWGDLSYLGNPVPEHARQGVVGFQALALGVVVWFVGVGIGNLRDTFRNMSPNKALTQLARTWQELTRSPEPSRRAVVPLVVGGILLVVFLLTLQVQTDYLLRHSYSNEAKNITFVTTAPLWEESVKIGSAVVGGALFSSFGVLGL